MTNDKVEATFHGVGKDVQKWADKAMFKAEPLKADEGIKVHLLWMTPDPLGAVAAMAKMYKGEVVRSLSEVTHAERREYMAEMMKTKLKAPLEAVKLHFMVEGVTRSFTHQMVRQRTAVYAQESLRFAVKEDMREGVALPPSLFGTAGDDELLDEDDTFSTKEQEMRDRWDVAVSEVSRTYNKLVDMGMPAEDARGLLPHNITTRLNYVTDLRALQDHAGNRLCTQAQFEWRAFFTALIQAMRNYNPHAAAASSIQDPELASALMYVGESDSWQYNAIADIFRPVCYLTGKCEFMAEFDRACSIRDRVEDNHRHGEPSSEWGVQRVTEDGHTLLPISPAEWLLDPAAARRK